MLLGQLLDDNGQPLHAWVRDAIPGIETAADAPLLKVELHVHPGGRITAVPVVEEPLAPPTLPPDAPAAGELAERRVQPPIVADDFSNRTAADPVDV